MRSTALRGERPTSTDRKTAFQAAEGLASSHGRSGHVVVRPPHLVVDRHREAREISIDGRVRNRHQAAGYRYHPSRGSLPPEACADILLGELLAELPAVPIVGPWCDGKTTTAARHAKSIVRLDRPAEAAAFRADPDVALAGFDEPVVLDEWQEVPIVLGAVKRAVDAEPRPGRFLLTGSVRADIEAETWPGTGRVVRVGMFPMTVAERLERRTRPLIDRLMDDEPLEPAAPGADLRGYVELVSQGGFPEMLSLSDQGRRRWLDSYIDQLLTRDAARRPGPRPRTAAALPRGVLPQLGGARRGQDPL